MSQARRLIAAKPDCSPPARLKLSRQLLIQRLAKVLGVAWEAWDLSWSLHQPMHPFAAYVPCIPEGLC